MDDESPDGNPEVATRDHDDGAIADRYRTIKYDSRSGPVTIIQDADNDDAWIQSDRLLRIEQ